MVLLACFILILGLLPSLVSLVLLRRLALRSEAMLRRAAAWVPPIPRRMPPELSAWDRVIGNPLCRFNARSPYLRCAINPFGPCLECSSYELHPEKQSF
jgi:hypothetical protein